LWNEWVWYQEIDDSNEGGDEPDLQQSEASDAGNEAESKGNGGRSSVRVANRSHREKQAQSDHDGEGRYKLRKMREANVISTYYRRDGPVVNMSLTMVCDDGSAGKAKGKCKRKAAASSEGEQYPRLLPHELEEPHVNDHLSMVCGDGCAGKRKRGRPRKAAASSDGKD